ncbi:hypothetical protein BDZ89DRAFT_1061242 [Hymenopellis radicata]|nr:hypothetical protein BDZ89DRAFT_1061242 [Hymenopellis radicata]
MHMNVCKKRSAIRVIRGYGERNSSFATEKGYRYDGLYVITHAWRQKGKQNKLMCRFLFQHRPQILDVFTPDIDAPTPTTLIEYSSSSSRSPSIASTKSSTPASHPWLSTAAEEGPASKPSRALASGEETIAGIVVRSFIEEGEFGAKASCEGRGGEESGGSPLRTESPAVTVRKEQPL